MCSINKYSLRSKKILIYGAGAYGIRVKDLLKKVGFKIIGFVDKRADEISHTDGIKCFTIDGISRFEHKEDFCIIVTFHNVFDHCKVAKKLFDHGFVNLIYKPVTSLNGNFNVIYDSINYAYESLCTNFVIPDVEIMKYEREPLLEFKDRAFISASDDGLTVKFYAPAELIFTNKMDYSNLSERNFSCNYIVVDLYRALKSNRNPSFELERYINDIAVTGATYWNVQITESWKNKIKNDRIAIYNSMINKMSLKPAFFSDNCTSVTLHKNGGFSLVKSGKNRVSFLISQGNRYVPLEISHVDYIKYINRDVLRKLIEYYETNSIVDLPVAIPHPYFYGLNYLFPEYMDKWGEVIGSYICNDIYSQKTDAIFSDFTISDNSDDYGTLKRFFSMQGFSLSKNDNCELSVILDNLLRINHNIVKKSPDYIIYTNLLSSLDFDAFSTAKIYNARLIFILDKNFKIIERFKECLYGFDSMKILDCIWNENNYIGYMFYR